MEEISTGAYVPYIFHMNWTQYKKEKLQFFRDARLWFVSDTCTEPFILASGAPDGEPLRLAECCVDSAFIRVEQDV
jgi:hypothetical protein